MSKCLICNEDLKESNKADEHIICNALGGVLKSKELTCKKCNKDFGSKCEAQLAEGLEIFANLLDIKRARGHVQPIQGSTATQQYIMNPGGKPSIVKPSIKVKEDGITKISIEARDRKQAKEVLEGLKRKYPTIDVEKTLDQIQYESKYIKDFVRHDFSFGGKNSFRAIAKMIFFLLKHKHSDAYFDTSKVIAFLKNEIDYKEIYFYYPDKDVVIKPDKSVYHSIVIKSYPRHKLLLGFAELYNTVSLIMVLSDDFSEELQVTYVFDVINRTEVKNPTFSFPNIDKVTLSNFFEHKIPPFERIKTKLESFLKLILERQEETYRTELIERTLNNSLKRYPEGTSITQEMLDELTKALMVELSPWLIENLRG